VRTVAFPAGNESTSLHATDVCWQKKKERMTDNENDKSKHSY
jgi:hypothetical protein